jgi:hypothetical protein
MTQGRLVLLVLLIALTPRLAHACPVCFQNVESPLLEAAQLGVLAMAAVTLGVLGAFGRWFLKLRRLQRLHQPLSDGRS